MPLEMTDYLMCLWVVVCTVSVGSPPTLSPTIAMYSTFNILLLI